MAAQKLASLVVDVVADISQIRGQLDQASAKISSFASGATKALGALGLAFGATEVASFALSIIDAAGDIDDMATKLGLSTDAVQKFGHAATLGGTNIETVADGIEKLNINISRGGNGTIAALKQLGISFEDIRQLSPEDQFLAITDALQRMESPQDRARLAMELMGRSATDLLPAIEAGFRGVADGADAMSEETIKRLAAAGDAWDELKNKVVIITGEIIAAAMKMPSTVESAWSRATSSMKNGANFLYAAMTQGVGQAIAITAAVEDATRAVAEHGEEQKQTAPAIGKTAEELKKEEEAQKKAAEAAKKHAEEISKLRDQLTGMDSVKAAKNLLEAARGLDLTKLSADNTKQALTTLNEAIEALKAQGKAVPPDLQRMRDALHEVAFAADLAKLTLQPLATLKFDPRTSAVVKGITEEFQKNADAAAKAATEHADWWERILATAERQDKEAKERAEEAKKRAEEFDKNIKNIAQGFVQLSQIGGGAFSAISKGIGSAIVMGSTAKDGFSALKGGITDLIGSGGTAGTGIKGMVGSIASVASGIGALLPIGISVFKGLKSLFGSAGRDMVEDFAKTFDRGFDGLQDRLDAIGRGDLWKKLTQGVGRNDKDAAKATIAEVQAALDEADARFNDKLQSQLEGIREFGGQIPEALQPYLDTLMEGGRITQGNIDLLKEMANGGEVDWKKMEDAAAKYGIEVDTLGDSFQRQKLHAGWQELIDDADLLVRGGADVNGMLVGMADEISALVNKSRQFGIAIPENMRGYIEILAEGGHLLDENGEKITDISGLTFGESLQTSVQRLVDSLEKLVQTLGGVPDAINRIPKNVDVNVNYRQNKYGDSPDGVVDVGENSFSGGTGGLRDFGSGTLAMLHNREAVLTESQYHALTRGSGPSITINVERGFYGPAADAELGELVGQKLDAMLRLHGYHR